MEIQANTHIVTNLNAGGLSAGAAKKQARTDTNDRAAELSSDFGAIQKKALQTADDPAAVEAARVAMKNGELDSETALLSAADAMLMLGL